MAKEKKTVKSLLGMEVDEFVASLNKEFGDNSIALASKALGTKVRYFSSGVAAIDIATRGGIPVNRFTEIRGNYSTFKTTVALLSIAAFQTKYKTGEAFFVDLEKTFDAAYAKKLGCDLARLWVINPTTAEESIDMMKQVMSRGVHIYVVIDSIAAMVPQAEDEADMEQKFMGAHAALLSRAMRGLTTRMKRNMYDPEAPITSILFINQLREKVGVVYGNPETAPGGKAKDFYYSMLIRLNTTEGRQIKIEKAVGKAKKKIKVGQTIEVKVLKNKCGGPQYESGEFDFFSAKVGFYPAHSPANAHTLFEFGCFYEVIEFTPKTGYEFMSVSDKTEDGFRAKLHANPKVAEMLRVEILKAMREETQIVGFNDLIRPS